MASFFKRRRIKTPTTAEIQNATFFGNLPFKKLYDLFRPGLESSMEEIPDNTVQEATLKMLQTLLNGIHGPSHGGFERQIIA